MRTPLAVQQRHARTLAVGACVTVQDDAGRLIDAQVLDEPWLLGGHTFVVNCAGGQRVFRAYDVMRVQLKRAADDSPQRAQRAQRDAEGTR